MASHEKQNSKKKTNSKDKKQSSLQKHVAKPGSSGSEVPGTCITRPQNILPESQIGQNELHLNVIPLSKKAETSKVSNKPTCKRKKSVLKLRGCYSLRSLDGGRVLRSRLDSTKCNTSLNQTSNPENLVTRAKKSGKKKVKKSDQDELSRIKKHIRYMLNRMNYEQSLIDAYSGEGWKGQSAEKIRPEKELGRAKSEILRCKLKIREIFQHLDSLLAEGRLQESLFDPDGIDSENIFCGKCGSKEVSTDNDIILCDGVCERGFHQKCLNPPLLSEDIPSGDEGWLCPECDCKLECIDLLSEFLGKDLSIEDSWKKLFPEAAALANGNGENNDLNLPSDDSEDDDYNPDTQGVDVDEQEEGPSCKASDSSSSQYGSTSSDVSEDDDYDPDALDPDKEIQNNKSSSDGSDFTSDSDEFCAELGKNARANESSASSPQRLEFFIDSGRDNMKDQDMPLDHTKLPSPMRELEKKENDLMSTNKRGRERLDYKKLYEEAYGKSSSDSSDDEDWNQMSTPKKLMKVSDKEFEEEAYGNSSSDSSDDEDWNQMSTPKKLMKVNNKEFEEDAIHSAAKSIKTSQKSISSTSASAKAHVPHEHQSESTSFNFHRLQGKSDVASKILFEAFHENQHPTKEKKESLAQELGMTFQQVTKWFGNARHRFRVASTRHKPADAGRTTTLEDYYKKKLNEVFQENQYAVEEKKEELATKSGLTPHKILHQAFQESQYPTKEKKESLAQELGMTYHQVTKWFSNARHSFHAGSTQRKATDAIGTITHEKLYKKKLNEVFQENKYPSKQKKEVLAQELGMTPEKVSRWFETARRNSRASAKESSNPTTSNSGKDEASSSHKLDIVATDETTRGEIDNLESCATPGQPRKEIDTESPQIPSTNGDSSSNENGKKAVRSTSPKGASEGFRDGLRGDDNRQKAIARELRRMRTGR